MDNYEPLKHQVGNIYRKHLLSINGSSNNNSIEETKDEKLYRKTYDLLVTLKVNLRHSEMPNELIQSSINSMDNFDAKNAATALKLLERFAKNLILFPWKSGYWKIKIYSGVVRLKINNCLKGTDFVFKALGYRKHKEEFILEKKVSREERELIALDCYIASVEMEIYSEIYDRVSHQGFSYRDVHRSREQTNDGDVNACEIWINKHCTPSRKYNHLQHETLDNTKNIQLSRDSNEMHYSSVRNNLIEPNSRNFSIQDIKPEESDSITRLDNRNKYQDGHTAKILAQTDHVYDVPNRRNEPAAIGSNQYLNNSHAVTENSYVPGTIDEHVKESLKLLEEEAQKPPPAVSPPSYHSVYPESQKNPQKYDEWGDVRRKIQGMGGRFADPGGRGDILRGDNMVPVDGNLRFNQQVVLNQPGPMHSEFPPPPPPIESDEEFPPPPPPEREVILQQQAENARIALAAAQTRQATSCGVQASQGRAKPFLNIVSDSRRMDVVADGPESPEVTEKKNRGHPGYQLSSSTHQRVGVHSSSKNVGGISNSSSRDTLQSPQAPFSTFKGGSPETQFRPATHSPILKRPMMDNEGHIINMHSNADIDNDPAANDVYVSLREPTRTTYRNSTELHHSGKPSYHDNFQKTTQRFYEGEQFQSLPIVSDNNRNSAVLANISKPTPNVLEKDKKNYSLQRGTSADNWQCPKCTFANHSDIFVCEICGGSRSGESGKKLVSGGLQCRKCTFVNSAGSENCSACHRSLKGSSTYI